MTAEEVQGMLEPITAWAKSRPDVRAVALVGSWARGGARPDSDLDLMLLVSQPRLLQRDTGWLEAIPWGAARPAYWQDEDYGAAWSRRVFLEDGSELEFTFSLPAWARTAPVDPGTFRVINHGCRIVHDPEEIIERLIHHLKRINPPACS